MDPPFNKIGKLIWTAVISLSLQQIRRGKPQEDQVGEDDEEDDPDEGEEEEDEDDDPEADACEDEDDDAGEDDS